VQSVVRLLLSREDCWAGCQASDWERGPEGMWEDVCSVRVWGKP